MAIETFILTAYFNSNGGSGGASPVSAVGHGLMPIRLTVKLASTNSVSRDGYHCIGWSTSASALNPSYSGGADFSYTFYSDSQTTHSETFYAVWRKNIYYITYKPGQNGIGQDVTDGKTHGVNITLRGSIFTRDGYVQVGWSDTDGGDILYSLNATYTKNVGITLYPVWAKLNYAHVRVNGVWKDAMVYIKSDGVWKETSATFVKIDGVWKPT